MNEPSYLTTIGYNGIVGNSARSISLWMRSGAGTGSFMGWGDSSDRWDFAWNQSGPYVDIDNDKKEQGRHIWMTTYGITLLCQFHQMLI